jgi:RimJ/RimL family protein N-acetyltransferase
MPEPAPETVELIGDGLRLRPYRSEDASVLLPAVRESIDSLGRWLPWCHAGYGEADAAAWIAHCEQTWRTGEHFAFAVFDAETAVFMGAAGLNQRNRMHNFMNLGYWVRASRQRQGITVRAARLVAAFGFQVIGLTRIEILAELDNRASRRVAESLCASFEAIARNRLIASGVPTDAAVYALIP